MKSWRNFFKNILAYLARNMKKEIHIRREKNGRIKFSEYQKSL